MNNIFLMLLRTHVRPIEQLGVAIQIFRFRLVKYRIEIRW